MDRPNVLLITTDQQRFDTLNAAGNPHIYTPHLNWLMDDGVHFQRCYTSSPICVAARASIMTGRQGYRNGLTTNDGSVHPMACNPTLPGILTQAGYQTRAQGKMHFNPRRANYGFEHMEILEDYYREAERHPEDGIPLDHGMGQNEMEPVISTVDDNKSLTHWTVRRSIDFIETRDDSRPFFLWTSFSKPHPPFDPCRNYWELYRDREVPAPVHGDWSQTAAEVPLGFMQSTFCLNNAWRMSAAQIADARRAYYACITQIDYHLGLLFARMRDLELFDNTWIIFTSDHGEMLGDHHMGAKSLFLEGASHVPMLIRPPAKAWQPSEFAGQSCDKVCCLADILPTVLAMAGVPLPEEADIDGTDMMTLLDPAAEDRTLIGQCGDYAMVLEGKHKFHYTSTGGHQQLFDLAADPYEQHELLAAGTATEVADRLRQQLVAHFEQFNNPAAKDGQLQSLAEPLPAKQVPRWPGFHHRDEYADVLH